MYPRMSTFSSAERRIERRVVISINECRHAGVLGGRGEHGASAGAMGILLCWYLVCQKRSTATSIVVGVDEMYGEVEGTAASKIDGTCQYKSQSGKGRSRRRSTRALIACSYIDG
jgi:hypothetical protein